MSRTLTSRTPIALAYAGWWLLWMGVQTYLMISTGFDLDISLTDSSVTMFIFAAAGYITNTSMHAYQPGLRNSIYFFLGIVGLAAACAFIQIWMLSQIISEDSGYLNFLSQSLLIRGAFGYLMITIVAILTWFWVYVSERHEIEKRKDDAAKLTREAELSKLRQQLQPHFLFNSLNSISALAGTRPEEARKMIQQLSDFLRGTVKKDDSALITLEDELTHLQLYLDIEKVRFGHRLNVQISKNDEAINMKLPSLLLQPIVENAIKFGLYDTVGEITISISAKVENNMLTVAVRNPFDPATSSPQSGTGFGLSSVQRRLYLLYFRNDLVETIQFENEFVTTVKIPQSA